jgi:hypothetical protein
VCYEDVRARRMRSGNLARANHGGAGKYSCLIDTIADVARSSCADRTIKLRKCESCTDSIRFSQVMSLMSTKWSRYR